MNNKKITIFLSLIIGLAIIFSGGFYFYQKSTERESSAVSQEDVSEGEECEALIDVIIDGVFQEVKDGFLYLQPKDENQSVEMIKITQETTFLEMVFSTEMEVIEQRDISLADFKKDDQISVVALCHEAESENKKALTVRHMVIKE